LILSKQAFRALESKIATLFLVHMYKPCNSPIEGWELAEKNLSLCIAVPGEERVNYEPNLVSCLVFRFEWRKDTCTKKVSFFDYTGDDLVLFEVQL
jgi:hypothetical protein